MEFNQSNRIAAVLKAFFHFRSAVFNTKQYKDKLQQSSSSSWSHVKHADLYKKGLSQLVTKSINRTLYALRRIASRILKLNFEMPMRRPYICFVFAIWGNSLNIFSIVIAGSHKEMAKFRLNWTNFISLIKYYK